MMSTVFNNVVNLGSTDELTSDLKSFQDLPADELSDIIHRVKGILAAFFLGTVILPEGQGSEENRRANVVIREPYLWALLRGRGHRELEDRFESNELLQADSNGRDTTI